MNLHTIDTPALIIDEVKMDANIAKMSDKAKSLGVTLRPHLKTSKCWEVAKRQIWTPQGPATVSTLKEAEEFAAHGVTDMIYAVGIAPQKLHRVANIIRRGVDLKIILDSTEAAQAVTRFCQEERLEIKVLIEIDCDGHRSGLKPDSEEIVRVAQALEAPAKLVGVLTHAGGSYDVDTHEALLARSRCERDGICRAAQMLRNAGFDISIVSVGSTPTALTDEDLKGVTELRAGVYVFFDLFQAGVGICKPEDIALSLLVTVIGHQLEKGWVITDGGWMAMSRDRGTAAQAVDWGYGMVCDEKGKPIDGLWMKSANQEHGIVATRDGSPVNPETFPVGTRLTILPNHACPTAAAFDKYFVVDENNCVQTIWTKINNW